MNPLLKRVGLTLTAMLLTVAVYAQPYENDYFTFDNPSGNIVQENFLLNPALLNRAMNLTVKEWSMQQLGLKYQKKIDLLAAGNEARVAVFVFDGRASQVAEVATQQYFDVIRQEATKDFDRVNQQARAQRVPFPGMGDANSVVKEHMETVSFMGDAAARLHTMDVDLTLSPLFMVFELPVMFRFQAYTYYDTAADKTVLAIFHQFGVNRDPNAAIALQADAYKLLLGLFGGAHGMGPAFEQWKQHSTWKDMRPLFEKYFHLKHGVPAPPTDNKQDITEENGRQRLTLGGRMVKSLLPDADELLPVPPADAPVAEAPPANDAHPESGWRCALGETTAPRFAENDTAVYVMRSGKQIVAVNKKTWQTTAINCPDERQHTFFDVVCTAEGRLLAYVKGLGLVDEQTGKTIWTPEQQSSTFWLMLNPVSKHIVLHNDRWAVELQPDGEELYAYEFEQMTMSAFDAEGQLLLYSNPRTAMARAVGDDMTDVELPRTFDTNTGLKGICNQRGRTVFGYQRSLYDGQTPFYQYPQTNLYFNRLFTDSHGELYTWDYSKGIIHFTGQPVSDIEVFAPDLRFIKSSKAPSFSLFYIDRDDNFWIVQDMQLYVWRKP